MGLRLNSCMRMQEANVIGSSVRLDEIPPAYRKWKLLGRGATTLAFERDAHTVVIFTRDAMKLDWLRDGIRMVQDYQILNPVKGHHIRGMMELPLFMVVMPKLYPLDAENKRKVTAEMRAFTDITRRIGLGHHKMWHEKLSKVVDAYHDQHPDSVVLPLLEWLMNYDPEQFYMDMGARQFKQTASGDVVLLDPIVSKELLDLLIKKHT